MAPARPVAAAVAAATDAGGDADVLPALRTADGLALHRRRWRARADRRRGTVWLVHGLGEHVGRYETLAGELAAAGWDVVAHDHRGHGRSDGPRGDAPGGDTLAADLGAALADEALAGARGPRVLLGHSLGGLVAARYVAEGLRPQPAAWWRPVDALVLSSPALALPLTRAQSLLLAVAAPLAPHVRLGNGLEPSWISRDPAVVRAYTADPLVHDRVAPVLVRWMVDAGQTVRAAAPHWRTPTLLMWGGADRCVDPGGSRAFADAAAPTGAVQAQPWPALAHEIFNEPERADVVCRLLRWLDARFPVTAAAGAAPAPRPSPSTPEPDR